MKNKPWFALATAALLLTAACGSLSTVDGVKQMKATAASLEQSVGKGDAQAVKSGADQLEQTWEKFEDSVKKSNKDVYDKVENPLHAIAAGADAKPLDKAALNKSLQDLNAALDQLAK